MLWVGFVYFWYFCNNCTDFCVLAHKCWFHEIQTDTEKCSSWVVYWAGGEQVLTIISSRWNISVITKKKRTSQQKHNVLYMYFSFIVFTNIKTSQASSTLKTCSVFRKKFFRPAVILLLQICEMCCYGLLYKSFKHYIPL